VVPVQSQRSRSPVRGLLIGVLASVLLSVGSSFLLGHQLSGQDAWPGIIILLLWLASFIAAAAFVVIAIRLSFRTRDTIAVQVRVILVSVLGLILVFTGLYFSMALIGDHDYAEAHYAYYQSYGTSFPREIAAREIVVPPFEGRQRAFVGIGERLWGTLDDGLPAASIDLAKDPQAYRARLAGQHPFDEVATFRPSAVWSVLSDCLHLSVMTIATVGYGNISPNTWYAKLATNAEALTGTALLVVALALILGGHKEP